MSEGEEALVRHSTRAQKTKAVQAQWAGLETASEAEVRKKTLEMFQKLTPEDRRRAMVAMEHLALCTEDNQLCVLDPEGCKCPIPEAVGGCHLSRNNRA